MGFLAFRVSAPRRTPRRASSQPTTSHRKRVLGVPHVGADEVAERVVDGLHARVAHVVRLVRICVQHTPTGPTPALYARRQHSGMDAARTDKYLEDTLFANQTAQSPPIIPRVAIARWRTAPVIISLAA